METIVLISLLTIFASFAGTLTGFGASTIMVPFVALAFPMPVTLLFVGVIHFFNDIWKMSLFRQSVNWRFLALFAIPGSLASIFGAQLALGAPSEYLVRVLGGVLIVFSIANLFAPNMRLAKNGGVTVASGALSGFLAGILGIGGPVRAMVLSAYRLKKEVYLFTSGATAVFIDLFRVGSYVWGGTSLSKTLLWGLIFFIPASLLGAEIAKSLVGKIPQKGFNMLICGFLFLFGVKFLLLG